MLRAGTSLRRATSLYSASRTCVSLPKDIERKNALLKEGDVYHGFRVFEKFEVEEKNWICYRMKHERTRAEYFHVDALDKENTFGVIFRTQPDSSGVAHILEHTTLCGSKQFPVRDPFFNMLKRSINTYMNAWTGYDWTAYPFSTQNPTDFKNLLRVYLDAVFFPNLNHLDFLQEGHRLELDDPSDLSSPVEIKGVVYNEMKGANTSPDRQIIVKLQSELFPSNITYHYDSGGDPALIPSLTYEQLKKFHKDNYHPSNARFYSYGDISVESTLSYLNDDVLHTFEASKASPDIPTVERFTQIKNVDLPVAPYPGAAIENGNTAVVSFLVNDITDIEESFTLEILSSLLLKGNSSPFYKARMEAGGLGKDFSVGTGYSDHTKEATFGFGIQGVKEEEIPKVYELIQSTLEQAASEGFSKERVESVLHAIELSKKNIPSNNGLNLFENIITPWVHGVNVRSYLDVDALISSFRVKMEDPTFLQSKIRQHFLNNPHGVKLVGRPDEEYNQKKESEEEEMVQHISSKLTIEDKKRIAKQQKELEVHQKTEQDREVLPKMVLSDIHPDVIPTVVTPKPVGKYNVQWSKEATSDISFVRGFVDTTAIPEPLIPYIPIFTSVFGSMGTKKYSYSELSQKIQNSTGGVSASWSVHNNFSSGQPKAEMGINFSSLALERKLEEMFEILSDVYTLDPTGLDQLKSNIQNNTARKEDSLMQSGHSYAMTHSSRFVSPNHQMEEKLSGVSHLKFLQAIKEEDYEFILEKITEIGHFIRSAPIRFAVNTDEKLFDKVSTGLHSFTNQLSPLSAASHNEPMVLGKEGVDAKKVFIPLASGVNYCSLSVPGVHYTHKDYPVLKVLSLLLSHNYLHPTIREQGGAYGAGLRAGESLSFYSYRDPNVEPTLEAFAGATEWIKKDSNFSDGDIEEAKISLFGSLDAPIVPSQRGLSIHSQGVSDSMRQNVRNGIFSTTRADLIRASETYLEKELPNAYATVIGNGDAVPEGWTVDSL